MGLGDFTSYNSALICCFLFWRPVDLIDAGRHLEVTFFFFFFLQVEMQIWETIIGNGKKIHLVCTTRVFWENRQTPGFENSCRISLLCK